jgi:hypothetical protein
LETKSDDRKYSVIWSIYGGTIKQIITTIYSAYIWADSFSAHALEGEWIIEDILVNIDEQWKVNLYIHSHENDYGSYLIRENNDNKNYLLLYDLQESHD